LVSERGLAAQEALDVVDQVRFVASGLALAIDARPPASVKSLSLERCRHSPQTESPQATLDAIVAFCAEATSAK
jgi:hypothetical protein